MTFEQWLATDHGMACLDFPVSEELYLRNRLWWAFEAGKKAGEQDAQDAASAVQGGK